MSLNITDPGLYWVHFLAVIPSPHATRTQNHGQVEDDSTLILSSAGIG